MRNYEKKSNDIMKFQPKEIINTRSSWRIGEIDIERARYLINTDEILEEILDDIEK